MKEEKKNSKSIEAISFCIRKAVSGQESSSKEKRRATSGRWSS